MKYLAHIGLISFSCLLLALAGCDESPKPAPNTNHVTVLETDIQSLALEDNVVTTRFGKLSIANSKPDMPPDTLKLDNNVVFQHEGFYLSLHQYIKQNTRDVILFGTNCGGSICPQNQFYFLLIEPGKAPEIVTSQEFVADPDDLKLTVDSERLILDLGFQAGKHKNAVLQGEKLGIELETVPKSFVGEENCRWLYDEALGACKDSQEANTNCLTPQNSFQGYLTRGIAAVSEHPGFERESFDRRCKIACESAKIVDYPTFAKEVCSKGK
ncbi:hypothetical protein [Thiothrix lacustris]|uniref:hypothetical protein n=1 Tax=Thiothrix lacustris TaxID=525917 RepID=UPI0027E4E6AF|nr:hypothetical protein [Thiothrix lacustris]WMP16145.1 hypothetical protein RCS87_12175 [Thiothrix lacustris]